MTFLSRLKTLFVKQPELYTPWDNAVNPRLAIYRRYGEPGSMMTDDRRYKLEALAYLREHGDLIEEYVKVKEPMPENEYGNEELLTRYSSFGSESSSSSVKYWYKDNVIDVTIEGDAVEMNFYRPLSKSFVDSDFSKWVIKTKGESKISILISQNGGLAAKSVSFEPPVIDDIELNYGTGFTKTYDKLTTILESPKSSLILIQGTPGSGKSTLLKHLSAKISKDFIFISPGLADQLASPSFISLLMNRKDSILVLEDAENAVFQRGTENSNSTAVSTLLNLSDGFIGSLLGLKIIVSMNCDRHLIDKALLRKGRLSLDLTVGALSVSDAQRLADKLGKTIKVTHPMVLADIYGVDNETGYTPPEEKVMGFGALMQSLTRKNEGDGKKEKVAQKS